MSIVIKDTDGLYYPYIHVRDEEWLKTTLLYFPHILRMVPSDFETGDSAFIQSLADTAGARGQPLLGSYQLGNLVTSEAVDRLTERLIHDIRTTAGFAERFSRKATQEGYGKDSKFLIHRSKAPQYFWSELTERGLMWLPSELELPDPFYSKLKHLSPDPRTDWAAVHPILGEAFMATVAVAAARDSGLEVVTDSSHVHAVASCRDETLVYQTLIRGGNGRAEGSDPVMTLRLSHLVIAGGFDVSKITAEDIAKCPRIGRHYSISVAI